MTNIGDPTDSKQREPIHEDPAPSKSTEPIPDDETERTPVQRRPQTFVEYDEPLLDQLVERHDTHGLNEKFDGVEGLARALRSDLERGIDASTLEARTEQWGVNMLEKKDPVTFLEFLLDALGDRVIQILVVAAIISIIFGMTLKNPHTNQYERQYGWIEGTAIIISVLVVVLVGSINNYQKAKKFEELERDQAIKDVEVIRGGEEAHTTTDKLQVGDLLKIEVGMEMTCDCVVVKTQGLKMNESALTGEPDLVEKDSQTNAFVISGTFVEEGNAVVMVIAVGMGSFQGRLKGALDAESGDTPLQEHLAHLADQIGIFGLVGAIILVTALSLKEIIQNCTQSGRHWSATAFLNFVLVAVALVAVAIPEGLPLAVTIALAFSMKAMMKDNCMVRVLASCETMGAATAICSDKTGTLTKNEMTLVQGLVAEEEFTLESYGLTQRDAMATKMMRPEQVDGSLALSPAMRDLFAEAVAVNSTATEVMQDGKTMWTGNKTEMGMLKFLALMGRDYKQVRAAAGPSFAYPFSSAKKRMTTLLRKATDAHMPCVVHAKGASETILADCKSMYNRNGDIVALTDDVRAYYEAIIVDMAKQGNRTIGIATGTLEVGAGGFPKDDPTDSVELVWLGVVGIQDPMREEVPAAVSKCQTAGITVRMVTGDNIHTAIAIAKKCGIYHDDGFDTALTGPEFRAMAEGEKEKLMALLPRLRVLARSSPNDKHILVGLLQEQGEVVAVTGDGTNDAPALKLADVGFAMNSGTDIAKGASAMVLLDDNFASVVNAVRWGRAVNDNVKKFLQYQLAINVGGVLLTLVGSLVSSTSKEPFTPVQLLWLNMIMDTLAALSLATELPEEQSLTRRPVYKQAPLLTNRMRVFILFHAAVQFLFIMLVFNLGHKWFDTIDKPDRCTNYATAADAQYCVEECVAAGGTMDGKLCKQGRVHSTIVFNIYIWFQVFNVVNARKIYGEQNPLEGAWSRSRLLIVIFLIIACLQVLAVELTGRFMQVTRLSGKHWGISIGFGAIELVAGFVQRLLQMPIADYIPPEVLEREAKIAEVRAELAANPEHEPTEAIPPLPRSRAGSQYAHPPSGPLRLRSSSMRSHTSHPK